MINNYGEYFSSNIDNSKLEEISKFVSRVEKFARSILPRMGNDMKAFLDISELVGQGVVGTLYIYGYKDMYNDEYEFGRVHDEKQMKDQIGGIVKSSIGKYSVISASTYWTAKKKLGRKTQEIGPYVCVEFMGDQVYEGILEEKRAKVIINDYYGKLSYAFNKAFDEDILKYVDVDSKIVSEIGLRINKSNRKALSFADDYGFKRVSSVGAHSQDKPTDDEIDFLLADEIEIAKCLEYIIKASDVKRVVSFINESSYVFEAKEPLLSKEDEKELEKTLLKIFKVNESFKRSPKLDMKLQKFCDKYADRWIQKGNSLKWRDVYKTLDDHFDEDFSSLDPDEQDYILTYIAIVLDDMGIDSSEVEEAKQYKKPVDLVSAIKDYNDKYSDEVEVGDKAYKIYKSVQKNRQLKKSLSNVLDKYFSKEESISEGKKKDGTPWTEEEIMDLMNRNDKVLYGALKYLYNEQTQDEKNTSSTREHNGRGFNAMDAEFLSSLAEQVIKRGTLSDKQKMYARKKLVKYRKQLTKLANQG